MDHILIFGGRPIQEATAIQLLRPIGSDFGHYMVYQPRQVGALLVEVIQVAMGMEEVAMADDPP